MDNSSKYDSSVKSLPPLGRSDDLPLPPSPFHLQFPPDPPPKSSQHGSSSTVVSDTGRNGSLSSTEHQTIAVSSPGPSSPKPELSSNLSPQGDNSRSKKANPFVDLLETERSYVDALSGIIRKIAAAWSRSNLPPHELDSMFRAVEAVFKANRSFHSKLKEIGSNPSSPRAIGDLLMKWIDQLETPYTNYCSSYLSGFDSWEPVQSNKRLPSILESFSASNPPPNTSVWTLDLLFSLPRTRIKYYQKLYGRLLKNSAPGKSTDKKLVEGVERLEKLLSVIDERSSIPLPRSSNVVESTDEVVIDTREINKEDVGSDKASHVNNLPRLTGEQADRISLGSSARESSVSSDQRLSHDTSLTSEGNASVTSSSMSLFDLERRLSTDRCRDLFTMNPRSVRLSMNPPNLPYTRELRLSEDANIQFTPKSTNISVLHQRGHIFLLTDLFLVCEHMTPEEHSQREDTSTDMWLCYPPLAAKHLRVSPIDDLSIQITILKKENMVLRFDSRVKRDNAFNEVKAVSELATALPAPSKQPPPPVPPLDSSIRSPVDVSGAGRRPSLPGDQLVMSPRSASPASGDPSMHRVDPARDFSSDSNFPNGDNRGGPPGPPPYSPTNGPNLNSTTSPPDNHPGEFNSFMPGQVIAPLRSDSTRMMGLPPRPGPGPNGPPSFSPGQVIPGQISRGDSVRTVNSVQHGMIPPQHTMSPPPMNGPPRHMMSPPPMNGMNGMPPPMGTFGGPQRNGSVGSMGPHRPQMGGPGPGPGPFPPGPGPMRGPQGSMPALNHPQPHHFQPNPPFSNPGRPSSDPNFQGGVRKTPSLHSLHTAHQYDPYQQPPRSAPPVPNPNLQGGFPPPNMGPGIGEEAQLRPMLPSAALPRIASGAPAFRDDSPPPSPTEKAPSGPVQSSILATMKCKVFLQQQHAQWKSLGSSKLTLYEQRPTMIKQLVVEADNKEKTMLISTIVLTDGVERVGKTGVAIELSDAGARTGIVYMLQLRNEKSASGFYETLLSGSDRGGFK